MDTKQLFERFTALGPMAPKTFERFMKLGEERSLEKHAFWSQPGEPVRHFALVIEGLVRHYYVDAKGRESVKAFRGPGEFSAPYAEIIQRIPSRTFIQALTATKLLTFDVHAFDKLAETSHEIQLRAALRRAALRRERATRVRVPAAERRRAVSEVLRRAT